jgi:hypothetical protein
MKAPEFDLAQAHRYFSAYCFNAAWDLIEKNDRTADDDRMMVALSQASIFHWHQRADVTDRNRSVGYWQASRVYALVGAREEAKRYADLCFSFSQELEPFHRAYAHEALARAAWGLGDDRATAAHLAAAWELAARVTDGADRKLLESDLESLGPRP